MKTVYVDIENALDVPFMTGIQRVVFELVPRLMNSPGKSLRVVPVRYCPQCKGWLAISSGEIQRSFKRKQKRSAIDKFIRYVASNGTVGQRISNFNKSLGQLHHDEGRHRQRLIKNFECDSIFFDLDSSWHNEYARSSLYRGLKEAGLKIVSMHYDSVPLQFPELVEPESARRFREHFNAKIEYSDKILCISRAVAKELQNYTGPRCQIAEIRLGDRFVPDRDEKLSELRDRICTPYIICVGTLEPRKNHALLLDVFDRLWQEGSELSLVLVGRNGWLSEKLIGRIKSHKAYKNRLHWLNSCSDNRLQCLYRNAFMSIVPSLYEGFGLPVTESLAAGCVTLCSTGGALPEAGGKYAEYFDPCETDSLLALIRRLRDHPVQYSTLKKLVSSRTEYTWEESTERIAEMLIRS